MSHSFDKKKSNMPKASKLLDVDAWFDSKLYEARFAFSQTWEAITIFFRRFRVSGWRRFCFELLSEGFTLGTVASMIILALAIPAFEETQRDWRAQNKYAVTFLDRYGNEIGTRGIIKRDSVPVDQMPDHLIKSVIATEDRRFFSHYGIDFLGLARAMFENARANAVVQGGSTLTQQLAKNLFLSSERTIERKVKEAFLSLWLETNFSKKEILQLYLDRAYMGGGTFGIAASAEFYFGKDVKDLNLAESAMLAGLFKAPAKYAPHVNLPAARLRANEVLTNLVQGNFLTEGQVVAARQQPATPVDREDLKTADYFLDWAYGEAIKLAANTNHRSMIARTTLDLDIQHAAEEACEFHLRKFGKNYKVKQCANVIMETNGAVRAIVGGRDYGQSQFNRATKALRQAGSSFKPFVYAAAIEENPKFTPDTIMKDAPIKWGTWEPKNYGRSFAGNVTLAKALAKSINSIPVRLLHDYIEGSTQTVRDLAVAMGVEADISLHKTMSLGTSGMTVMDQATAYTTFANGGMGDTRHTITQLTTFNGDVIYSKTLDAKEPTRVMSKRTVQVMNQMLVQVPEIGTAKRSQLEGIPSAGKTGTTQSYRDAWFVGYTGNFVGAVWMGNDNYKPTNRLTGGNLPAMTWQRFMTKIHKDVVLKEIPGAKRPVSNEANNGNRKRKQNSRPMLLSNNMVKVLQNLSERFSNQQRQLTDTSPETVSSITPQNSDVVSSN